MPRRGERVQPGVLTPGIPHHDDAPCRGTRRTEIPYNIRPLVTTADLTPLQGEPFLLGVAGVETPG